MAGIVWPPYDAADGPEVEIHEGVHVYYGDTPASLQEAGYQAPPEKGAIVMLRPRNPEPFTEPGGQSPDIVHQTLVFIAEKPIEDPELVGRIGTLCQHLADSTLGPLEGKVSGVGTIGKPEEPAQVLITSVLGCTQLRAALAYALRLSGIEYATNYDWVPHITVRYGADPLVMADWAGKPVQFDGLVFANGDQTQIYPFRPREVTDGHEDPSKGETSD